MLFHLIGALSEWGKLGAHRDRQQPRRGERALSAHARRARSRGRHRARRGEDRDGVRRLHEDRLDGRTRVQLSAGVHRARQRARRAARHHGRFRQAGRARSSTSPPAYRVIVDRISHEVEYYRGYPEIRGAERDLRDQQPVLVDLRRQVLQLLPDVAARRRDSEDRAAAAEGVSGRRRHPAGVAAQPRLSARLGRAARLRRPAGDPQAVLRRRLEARLQGRTRARS